jgi:hypothetical protein
MKSATVVERSSDGSLGLPRSVDGGEAERLCLPRFNGERPGKEALGAGAAAAAALSTVGRDRLGDDDDFDRLAGFDFLRDRRATGTRRRGCEAAAAAFSTVATFAARGSASRRGGESLLDDESVCCLAIDDGAESEFDTLSTVDYSPHHECEQSICIKKKMHTQQTRFRCEYAAGVCMRMCLHRHVHAHVHTRVHAHARVNTRKHVCAHVQACVCACASMCILTIEFAICMRANRRQQNRSEVSHHPHQCKSTRAIT